MRRLAGPARAGRSCPGGRCRPSAAVRCVSSDPARPELLLPEGLWPAWPGRPRPEFSRRPYSDGGYPVDSRRRERGAGAGISPKGAVDRCPAGAGKKARHFGQRNPSSGLTKAAGWLFYSAAHSGRQCPRIILDRPLSAPGDHSPAKAWDECSLTSCESILVNRRAIVVPGNRSTEAPRIRECKRLSDRSSHVRGDVSHGAAT